MTDPNDIAADAIIKQVESRLNGMLAKGLAVECRYRGRSGQLSRQGRSHNGPDSPRGIPQARQEGRAEVTSDASSPVHLTRAGVLANGDPQRSWFEESLRRSRRAIEFARAEINRELREILDDGDPTSEQDWQP
jgi:hypothetical protein